MHLPLDLTHPQDARRNKKKLSHQKIGDLELAKMDLLYEANTHRESLKKLGADLEAKYGRITINLGTGEYSLIEEGDGSKV